MAGLRVYWLAFLAVFLAGCGVAETAVFTPPTPIITDTPTIPAPVWSTATPQPPDSGWHSLRPGLEQRTISLYDNQEIVVESLTLLRLEPDQFQFRLGYRPGQPQSLPDWQAETEALLVVNGGYFTEDNMATGLLVLDGVASGIGYGDFAGMFTVTDSGPELRWLRQRPYSPQESILYAFQSFPLLVRPDGQPAFPQEDGVRARRTVMGQDENGRILFLIAPYGHFTLYQLSQWLAQSDLNLQIALNLDGGKSTGFFLAQPEMYIPTFVLLPLVITIHPHP